jgi:hypothetical protein
LPVTGLLIGTANAERLYDSNAFTVKMAARPLDRLRLTRPPD